MLNLNKYVSKVLWKRLNTESDPKNRKPPQNEFFEAFPVFSKIIGNPSNPIFKGISHFFWSVSSIFRSDSGLSGSYIVEGFPNIFEGFPNILEPFPHFFSPFPVFRKSLKFLVRLLIGFLFFGPVSSFFGSVSGFQKKF